MFDAPSQETMGKPSRKFTAVVSLNQVELERGDFRCEWYQAQLGPQRMLVAAVRCNHEAVSTDSWNGLRKEKPMAYSFGMPIEYPETQSTAGPSSILLMRKN